jgi:plastocyanin
MSKFFLALWVLLAAAGRMFADVGVSIEDNFFSPANITIPKGTTVNWTHNGRNTHTVTSGTVSSASGLFDSGNLNPGQVFSFQFNSTGVIPYFCRIHGSLMTGTVTVTCPNKSQLLKNPGFEGGNANWNPNQAGIITNTTTFPPHGGKFKAQLNGTGQTNTASIFQQVAVPSNACSASLSFFLRISTTETTTTQANDKLKVQILNTSGKVLRTLKTYSNLDKSSSYQQKTFNILNFKGQTIRIRFIGTENSSLKTTFLIDDTAVRITR